MYLPDPADAVGHDVAERLGRETLDFVRVDNSMEGSSRLGQEHMLLVEHLEVEHIAGPKGWADLNRLLLWLLRRDLQRYALHLSSHA